MSALIDHNTSSYSNTSVCIINNFFVCVALVYVMIYRKL